ncbi:MAG TPA: two-component regulator propeller domain-containing protein, partial [Candidatus Paceibacterota bacterium]|nr:two-component regulator propeller domain-containing protein [Candidatus Paceibacterota bacterium]
MLIPSRFRAAVLWTGFLFFGLTSDGLFAGSAAVEGGTRDYLLQAWQSEDGLPHQVVNGVLQDQQGFIWLATETALVRFDGIQFKEFSSPLIGNEKSSRIRALIQEDASTLLIAPDIGGLVRLRKGQFSPHPASTNLADIPVATLFAERGGAIWIGYLGGETVRWDSGRMVSFGGKDALKGQFTSLAYDGAGRLWFANSMFLGCYTNGTLERLEKDFGDRICIASSRSGGLWIASNERLCRLQHGEVSMLIDTPPWGGAARVRALYEDSGGNLWIGTSARGLYRFNHGQLTQVPTSYASINAVREDVEGNIWVATHGGGLDRLRPRIFDLYNKEKGLLDDLSYSVFEDVHGSLWVGNCDGGLARFEEGKFRILTRQENWPALRVFSIGTDTKDSAWIGTRTGLYRLDSSAAHVPEKVEENVLRDIHVIHVARDGDVWVGADPDGLGRFRGNDFRRWTSADGFSGSHVRAITEDKSGNIWVGTEAGDMFCFRGERFERFT